MTSKSIEVGRAVVEGKGSLAIMYDPFTHYHSYRTPDGGTFGTFETYRQAYQSACGWLDAQQDAAPLWLHVSVVASYRAPVPDLRIFTKQTSGCALAALYEADVARIGGVWHQRGHGWNNPDKFPSRALPVLAEVTLPFAVERGDGATMLYVFPYAEAVHLGLSRAISLLSSLDEYVAKGVAAAFDGRAARDSQQLNWRELGVLAEEVRKILVKLY